MSSTKTSSRFLHAARMLSVGLIPGRCCTSSAAATTSGTRLRSATGPNSHSHTPSPKRGNSSAPTCDREAGLAHPTHTREGDHAGVVERLGDLDQLAAPTHERRHLQRQIGRERIQRAQRRELDPATLRAATWKIRSGRDRSRSRCSPRSTNSHSLGSASRTNSFGGRATSRSVPRAPTASTRAARFTAGP